MSRSPEGPNAYPIIWNRVRHGDRICRLCAVRGKVVIATHTQERPTGDTMYLCDRHAAVLDRVVQVSFLKPVERIDA